MKKIFVAGAMVVSLLGASLASAAIVDNKIRVQYSKEELQSATGRAEIQHRIETAAKRACGSTQLRKAGSVLQVRENMMCFDNVVDALVSKIGDDRLASNS